MRKPCCDKQDTNKGAWSKQEDQKLIDYIREHGEGCWRTLPQAAGLLRCGKSCRLRWINYLRPDLKRGNFDEDEEDLIIKLHALLGNRWSLIAGRLPGRTDNEVKNYWNSHLRRKLMKMGIDPNNHRLNHIIPRQATQVPDNNVSTSATSSSIKVCASQSTKSRRNHIGEKKCDAKNSSEEVPDLNLDLTISIESTSKAKDAKDLNPTIVKMASGLLNDQSPTLLLFR